ncbi:hypothetical protein D9756_005523 [Leucocoprinus leucothites]|uniref:Uncharacterized protein n=1 Tax=Leucocoprinus leucothites TaxID=201217 RepID=A0A8H5D833_9AGAR|nr:hypothetical protein D9756_005523 [Leucoagaricus leucothites]
MEVNNEQNASSSSRRVKIVSPVPLPYNARSEAVLRSMMSFPPRKTTKGELDFWAPEKPETPVQPSPASIAIKPQSGCDQTAAHALDSLTCVEPTVAATLMALTEPFLMAWCPPPEKLTAPPIRIEERNLGRAATSVVLGATTSSEIRNSWGY